MCSKFNILLLRVNISGCLFDVVVFIDRVLLFVYIDLFLFNNDFVGFILGFFLNFFGKYFNKRGVNRLNLIE